MSQFNSLVFLQHESITYFRSSNLEYHYVVCTSSGNHGKTKKRIINTCEQNIADIILERENIGLHTDIYSEMVKIDIAQEEYSSREVTRTTGKSGKQNRNLVEKAQV